ncbi:MAG: hypothetical protein OHK006_11790 [Thermodesulfovibrionales bacterium]
MPHFGLMSTAESFSRPEGALMRARLHVRAARRRLRQGKNSAGILTLYDAMLFALRWYVSDPQRRVKAGLERIDPSDDRRAYAALAAAGVIDRGFDYGSFDSLVERAMNEDLAGYDTGKVLADIEGVMTALGVMPFDEAALPAEDPSTF